MTRRRRIVRAIGAAWLVAVASCSDRSAPLPELTSLGADVVARVRDMAIPASMVADVATSRGISSREAVSLLVEDALAAQGALARRLDRGARVGWALTAARARRVVQHVHDEALAAGPPTEAEIDGMTKLHFREVDVPEQVVVRHALVKRPPESGQKEGRSSPQVAAAALALAEAIARAVKSAKTPEEFGANAKAVPRAGFDVIEQPLPPFFANGRLVAAPPIPPDFEEPAPSDEETINETFANAAFLLRAPGDTSGVVETPFGWHVIRLVERIPEKRLPLDERRKRFTEPIYATRARRALAAILKAGRAAEAIDVAEDAETLMAEVAGAP